MVFDYEGAWADLLAVLEEKPQWGTRQLQEEMARIQGRRRYHESGPAQMLRLYGVQTDILSSRASAASPPGGSSAGAKSVDAHPPSHTEVDVHEQHRNAA